MNSDPKKAADSDSDDDARRDEVLKRMLATKPTPHLTKGDARDVAARKKALKPQPSSPPTED
jgi:hypothetical protein